MSEPASLQNALGLRSGDRVVYAAKSLNKNLKATIVAVRPNGDVQIDCKPNHWLSMEEQKEKIVRVRAEVVDRSKAAVAEGSTDTTARALPPCPQDAAVDAPKENLENLHSIHQNGQNVTVVQNSNSVSKKRVSKANTAVASACPSPPPKQTSSKGSSPPGFLDAFLCLPLPCGPAPELRPARAIARASTCPDRIEAIEAEEKPIKTARMKLNDARSKLSAMFALASGLQFSGSMRMASKLPCEMDTATTREEIVRINDRYSESLLELSPIPDALASEKLADGTEYFCGIDGELFRTVVSRTFDGDPVKALAILSEVDLCQSWMPKVKFVEPLEKSSFPLDSLWHVKEKNGQLGLQDLVLHASFVDALNEPLQCLWFCMYTPLVAANEYKGVELPPPDADAVRSDMHTAYCIKPLGSDKFQLTVCVCLTLPPATLSVLWACPAFMVRRQARKLIEKKLGPFGKCLKASGEVDARLQGENAKFYKQVRSRVLDATCTPSYTRKELRCGM
mmetsp:Transcript_154931/g.273676  ORF Transcript_154931/g.273676 Transcript_154931/m.273676 type:complete len:508 (-) Transcript_154931:32-1555(-)